MWLPILMLSLLVLCGWVITPRVRVIEFIGLIFLIYVSTSALVSVCEISVTEDGLIIDRLLLPERFVPWEAINRVLIYAHAADQEEDPIEIVSISVYEGLSPLNRLPGLVYGQGFRQTIVVTPDTLENYEELMVALETHTSVYWHQSH